MSSSGRSPAERFFSIVANPRTYLEMLYLLLSFPLGIFYFVFLVTGLSLGLGLIITLLGIPILVGVIAASYALAAFERRVAARMLRVRIPPAAQSDQPAGFWARLRHLVASPVTWKGIGFLFAKFPLGILSFVVVVTLLSTSLALISAPLWYRLPGVVFGWPGVWQVDTLSEALISSLVGIALFVSSLHAFHWLAWASGRFARVALSSRKARLASRPSTPAEESPTPPV